MIKYFLFLILLISCINDKKITVEKSIVKNNTLPQKTIVDSIKQITPKFTKKDIRHFFLANGGSILYLNNGDIKGQARFDTDGDFLDELLKTETYGKYEEFDNYVIQKKSGLRDEFFEDFGAINGSWKILKGVSINNPMTVISYTSAKNSTKENTEAISETRLIIFNPKTKKFADENSQEAENYFTAMDDWNWYSHELNETFRKLGVKTLYLNKDNVKINIENGASIIIGAKNKINNYDASALLYKKGKRPIIIHLIISDNDLEAIKTYLN